MSHACLGLAEMLTSKLGIYFNKVKNKIIIIQNRAECVRRQAGRQAGRPSVCVEQAEVLAGVEVDVRRSVRGRVHDGERHG